MIANPTLKHHIARKLTRHKPSLTQRFTSLQPLKMRVPYADPKTISASDAPIVKRIEERRHPRPLQPLDLALLQAPPVADGWNSFMGAIRTKTTLPATLREIAISRVAACNRAWYEWIHHSHLAREAGVSELVMGVVGQEEEIGGERPEGVSTEEWAVLKITDEMTRNVDVKDETWDLVKAVFDDRGCVELVATVSSYNCVSRFLVALNVGEKNGTGRDAAH